jgi:hypothetical protein
MPRGMLRLSHFPVFFARWSRYEGCDSGLPWDESRIHLKNPPIRMCDIYLMQAELRLIGPRWGVHSSNPEAPPGFEFLLAQGFQPTKPDDGYS